MTADPPDSRNIVIWGAGGQARVVADALRLMGGWNVLGFIDDQHPERSGEQFCDAPVVSGLDSLGAFSGRGPVWGFVAIGDCGARLKRAEELEQAGAALATIVHPASIVSPSARLAEGAFVAAGSVIGPSAVVGRAAIVNTSASVDHDCIVEAGAHIAPGARLTGHVHIEREAFVGAGAVLVPNVRIGAGSVVGAGAVVLTDLPAGVVACGNPARIVKPARA